MADSSTTPPGGKAPFKDEIGLLEVLRLLIETEKAQTTSDLLKYASQYGAPEAEERLRVMEAENIPVDLAFDAISVHLRILAHKRDSSLLAGCRGQKVGIILPLPPHLPELFLPVADVTFLQPDEVTAHGSVHEFTERAVKGARACRAKAQEMQALIFEAFREGGNLFVDGAVADVIEPKMLPAGIRLIAHLRPHRNPQGRSNSTHHRGFIYMKSQLRPRFLFSVIAVSLALCGTAWASTAQPEAGPATVTNAWVMTWPAGVLMLVLLFSAFFAMTRYEVPLPLAMTLVSLSFLVIQWTGAPGILREGFAHYANITVLFTAVAIPAHMIERSQGFKWIAAWLGHQLGRIRLRHPRLTTPLLVVILLVVTYVTAGLMHNVTSILIMTPVIIRLCASYQVPSRWILSAALIASNLGGFSTRWGDTPNIIESTTWGLKAGDFMREVLPANLIVLATLIIVATFLTQRGISRRSRQAGATQVPFYTLQVAQTAADWKKAKSDLAIDRRLLLIGLGSLVFFIVLQLIFSKLDITIGAVTIVAAVLLERKKSRYHTLTSLGFDVYLAFAAIFVLAGCVSNSWIGATLYHQLIAAKAAPWVIAVTGYFGTTFTEAASWATAVSQSIQQLDPSHAAAWALGGGICAGSSSLVTAASAGIILAEESQRFNDPEHAINFRRYLAFGLPFSLFMLAFYAVYFTLVR